MVAVWIVVELLFVFLFFSLPAVVEVAESSNALERGPSPIQHTINSPSEGNPLLPEKKTPTHHSITSPAYPPKDQVTWSLRIWCLIREEPIVLLAVVFVTMFNQTGLEVGKLCNLFWTAAYCTN